MNAIRMFHELCCFANHSGYSHKVTTIDAKCCTTLPDQVEAVLYAATTEFVWQQVMDQEEFGLGKSTIIALTGPCGHG